MSPVRQIPQYLLDAVAAHSRTSHPREACGFLTGPRGGIPERFWPIPNMHAHPEKYYRMHDDSVVAAFHDLDRIGHDVLFVYHSHTCRDSELSTTDLMQANDTNAIYLVCSTYRSPSLPTFQAWQIVVADDGSRDAIEVAIDIIDSDHPDSPLQGLVEGNRVRVIYASEAGTRTIIATVGKRAEGGSAVTLYPVRPGAAGPVLVVDLERIRRVAIIDEGEAATATRSRAATHLHEAAIRLASRDTTGARTALEKAGVLMPRLLPVQSVTPRAYRPRRKTEA